MTVMSVNVVLQFQMSEMIAMNILVYVVVELTFQMDMTVEWDMMNDECV